MTFAKATLKTDEPRNDYIRRRHAAGAKPKAILAEINSEALCNAGPGKLYSAATVKQALYGDKKPDAPPPAAAAPVVHPAGDLPEPPAVSDDLLSADEIAAIRAQARAEILAELKAARKKDLLAKAKGEIRGEMSLAAGTNEPTVTLTINLAAYVDRIHLNQPYGPVYMHGRTYTVPISVAQVLMSQMYESWKHEDMRKGIPVVEKTSRNIVLSGKTGAVLGGNLTGLAGF